MMAALAIWFQDASTASGGVPPAYEKYIVIFLVLFGVSVLLQVIVYAGAGIAAMKAMKAVDAAVQEAKGAVAEVRRDLRTSTDEIKAKVYPVIESVTHLSKSAQWILDEAAPKLKIVSDHVVDTSRIVRDSAEKFAFTAGDVNTKTQRQVARVDGMVTAALDTTAEIVATVEHGIKVPAKKIATAANQARYVAEGVLERVKALAAGLPFLQGGGRGPATPYAASSGAAVPRPTGTTPASATGSVPLVK